MTTTDADLKATAAAALSCKTTEITSAKANKAGTIRARTKSGITFNITKAGDVTVWDADPVRNSQFRRGLSWLQPHPQGPLAKKPRTGVDDLEAPAEESDVDDVDEDD